MLRQIVGCLFAVLLALVPGAVTGGGDGSGRCSISPAPGLWRRSETILLARATADSVLAGAGVYEVSRHGGHSGPGGFGPIHGQVFEVERFSGADSVELARAFRSRGNARAVIVPWDYDASCVPARWTSGTVWVSPSEKGTLTLQVRPDSLWIEGMPVFDAAFAVLEPYPSSRAIREPGRNANRFRSSALMSAEQYFELLSALRPVDDLRDRPDDVWRTFLGWQRDHPDLVELYPANEIAYFLANQVSREKVTRVLRGMDPVIAGTYRMAAALNGEPERSFFLRTRARPMDVWRTNPPKPLAAPLEEPEQPEAYLMVAMGAPTLETLPTDCRPAPGARVPGYVYVIDPPADGGVRRSEWRGWIETRLVANQFPEDSAYARFHRQAFDEWASRWRANGDLEAPTRYWLDDDGTLRVEQVTRLADGLTLTVRGERIADTVVSCER